MAIDLEAIRRKVQELSGQRKSSNVQFWKPTPGEYTIRVLPWKNATEGTPFCERWFYYIGDSMGVLTLRQFGKFDPIDEFIHSLFKSGKPDDRVLAKKLMPKMRAYAPIIVRGEEASGVKLWSFTKFVYQRLLSFFVDEEIGDILDPQAGYDLKVKIEQVKGKTFKGKPVYDTIVDAARKPSVLSSDPEKVKDWLANQPDIDDVYQQKSAKEIEAMLNEWLNGDNAEATDGTERGGSQEDSGDKLSEDLDKLAEDIANPPAQEVAASAPEPKAKRQKKAVSLDDAPVKKQSLEDAFKELEKSSDDAD